MNDRVCNSCRYWQQLAAIDDDELGWRERGIIEEGGFFGARGHDTTPDTSKTWGVCRREDFEDPPMFTVDASGYYSTLSTQAGFSCSEHQAGVFTPPEKQ